MIFVAVEVLFALTSRSQSVLMDASNDAAETIVVVLTLFLTPLFYSPISEQHPYGFSQVESVFTTFKALMMLSVMLGLSVNVIQTMLSGGAQVNYGSVSLFQLVLGLFSLLILTVMTRWNRKISSPTIKAELLGWRLDVSYSMGLSAAFLLAKVLENTSLRWMAPYFDQIVALFVVAFALPDGIQLLRDSVRDIFLFAPDEETTQQIKDTCAPILEEFSFEPVFYDINRTGRKVWVEVYFDIEGDVLSADRLQEASAKLRKELSGMFGMCSCELVWMPSQPGGR